MKTPPPQCDCEIPRRWHGVCTDCGGSAELDAKHQSELEFWQDQYDNAIEEVEALNARLEPDAGWKPLKDEDPPKGVNLLAWDADEDECWQAKCSPKGFISNRWMCIDGNELTNVTHWRFPPEGPPPKKGSRGLGRRPKGPLDD